MTSQDWMYVIYEAPSEDADGGIFRVCMGWTAGGRIRIDASDAGGRVSILAEPDRVRFVGKSIQADGHFSVPRERGPHFAPLRSGTRVYEDVFQIDHTPESIRVGFVGKSVLERIFVTIRHSDLTHLGDLMVECADAGRTL